MELLTENYSIETCLNLYLEMDKLFKMYSYRLITPDQYKELVNKLIEDPELIKVGE